MNRKLSRTLLLIPLLAAAQDAKKPDAPAKVVFVCEHGSAKSIIAAAHFERLAKEEGLLFEVVARGTTPDPEIPAAVRNGLKADGITLADVKPAAVTSADLSGATKVISFGPDVTSVNPGKIPVEDWSATPAVSADYAAARSYIVQQLKVLLEQLRKTSR